MRIATWNIWWQFGDDFEARQPAIATNLRALDADVIGLQETWPGQVARLGEALDMYHEWVGRVPDDADGDPERGMGNAVLSRHPIRRRDDRFLDDGSGRRYRTVLGTEITTPTGPLGFFVTHLNYQFDESAVRNAQLGEVSEFVEAFLAEGDGLRQADLGPILVGDLNAVPDSDEIRTMTGRRPPHVAGRVWQDAWEIAGDGPGITWSAANPHLAGSTWPNRRIDYVLVGWPRLNKPIGNPVRAELFGTKPVDGVIASDHYGVVVDIHD